MINQNLGRCYYVEVDIPSSRCITVSGCLERTAGQMSTWKTRNMSIAQFLQQSSLFRKVRTAQLLGTIIDSP